MAYRARVVECAATHGLPAAPRMSHGPSAAEAEAAEAATEANKMIRTERNMMVG